MAGICFFYENEDIDVWSGKNLDAWNYAIKAAGDIDRVIVVNKTNQTLSTMDADLDFQVVSELPELENAIYLVCPWESHPLVEVLWDYDHTADWYIFGPAGGWRRTVPHGLCVPQSGRTSLHSVHIASLVMMHRYGVLS